MTSDLRELGEASRAALFAVRELEGDAALYVDPADVVDLFEDSPEGCSEMHLRQRILPDLEEAGLLTGAEIEKHGARNPRGYATTDAGQQAIEDYVDHRARQAGRALEADGTGHRRPDLPDEPIELGDDWQTVVEREERSSDRVDPFCRGCRAVYAGEGLCPDCREDPEEELFADGGGVPCDLCGTAHPDLEAALRCCSEVLAEGVVR